MPKTIEQRRDELIAQGMRIRDAVRQATNEARDRQAAWWEAEGRREAGQR